MTSVSDEPGGRSEVRRSLRDHPEVRTGLLVGFGVLAAAPVVGIVWWLIAPLPQLRVSGELLLPVGGEAESAVAADGLLGVCAAVAGLICALLVFSRVRQARVSALLGLSLGGLAAAVLAWRLGEFLGPGPERETARGLADGSTFDGPLVLSAKGVLFAWPMTAVIVYFALAAGLHPNVEESGAAGAPAAVDGTPVSRAGEPS